MALSAFSSIFIFMIWSLGIIKGNAPIITLGIIQTTQYSPIFIPELTVTDLAILVPVHSPDHGVYLCAGYLACTCVYSSQYSPHYPLPCLEDGS